MDYDTMFELFTTSGMTYREFYERLVNRNREPLEFEAFRSAMRRRQGREIEVEHDSESELLNRCTRKREQIQMHVDELLKERTFITGVFISDVHLPYTDWDAMEVTYRLLELVKPQYITGLNDMFDFEGYSRWPDERSAAARLWDGDIRNPLAMHGQVMNALQDAAPKAIIEGLVGNHDARMYRYLRRNANSLSHWAMAHFIDELESQGLHISSLEEQPIYLTRSLVLTHGIYATTNVNTTAAKTVEAFGTKQYADASGHYYNTIAGHDHRLYTIPSHGVTAYGNGCLCRTDMPYLRTPPNWQLGITVFHTNHERTWAYPIQYQTLRGELTANYGEHFISIPRSRTLA